MPSPTATSPAARALLLGAIATAACGPLAAAATAAPRSAPDRPPCPAADLVPTAGDLPAYADAIRCLVDERRRAAGRRRLRTSRALRHSAQELADEMVRERFFGHRSPDGETLGDRLRDSGYPHRGRAWRAAENIAWGRGRRSTPRAIVAAWMASPAHRANLLDGHLRETGFGLRRGAPVAADGRPAITVVQTFGVR